MLDRRDLEPVFFAPFVSSLMRVEPAWIDYNGHLNMAYYNVLFDRAVDEVFELLGCGADYVKKGFSTFTAEVHVRYLRELKEGDPVRVTFQLLDYDAKRMHYFEQLFHAEEGWVSATSENMSLHVDMAAKKTAPFPAEVTRRLIQMKAARQCTGYLCNLNRMGEAGAIMIAFVLDEDLGFIGKTAKSCAVDYAIAVTLKFAARGRSLFRQQAASGQGRRTGMARTAWRLVEQG